MDNVKINWGTETTEQNAVERQIAEQELNFKIALAHLETDPFTCFRKIDKLIPVRMFHENHS